MASTELSAEFQAAIDRVNGLSTDPGNDTKLRLYALYKQATQGDVAGKRPGFTNPVGRAKHDAREKVAGMSQDAAKEQYIALVDSLA